MASPAPAARPPGTRAVIIDGAVRFVPLGAGGQGAGRASGASVGRSLRREDEDDEGSASGSEGTSGEDDGGDRTLGPQSRLGGGAFEGATRRRARGEGPDDEGESLGSRFTEVGGGRALERWTVRRALAALAARWRVLLAIAGAILALRAIGPRWGSLAIVLSVIFFVSWLGLGRRREGLSP
jgi:hypothetical protein